MMFTTRMKYLVAVVLDRRADAVTRELLALGLLHFVKVRELQHDLESKVSDVTVAVSTTRIAEIRKRIESFLAIVQAAPEGGRPVDLHRLAPVDLDGTEKMLNDISARMQAFRDRQKAAQQEILKLEDINRQMSLFGDLRPALRADSHYSFLKFRAGTVAADRFSDFKKAVEAFPSVVLTFRETDDVTSALVITMKRDDEQTERILTAYDFTEAEITEEMTGVKEEVARTVERKIADLQAEQEKLNADSHGAILASREKLLALWENLKLNELFYRIQSYFSRTARTMLFSGWVPANRQREIEEAMARAAGDSCYLEWRSPDGLEREERKKVNVPVRLENSRALSPFQMLVTNFSIPRYGTIDPTPIVAVVFLAMFGLMFSDVGQGAVLFAAGMIGTIFRKRLFKGPGMRELVKLVAFCGVAAMLGGWLTGEFFGFPGIIRPLWFDLHGLVAPGGHVPPGSPVTNVIQVLVITLWFGIGVLSLGLVLNWINLAKTRQWTRLVFDRAGLVGGWMYAGAVHAGYYFVTHDFKALPDGTALFLALGLPGLLLLGKPVSEFIEHRRRHPEKKFTVGTPFMLLFEWVIELLEFFSGYLSNTLSFMRVAGLGIAHAALMIAFFEIAKMLSGGGAFNVWGYVIIVIGNLFVIALEGLSAGIQSLRLNYYEFFSKYFRGSGEAYKPVSLRNP